MSFGIVLIRGFSNPFHRVYSIRDFWLGRNCTGGISSKGESVYRGGGGP